MKKLFSTNIILYLSIFSIIPATALATGIRQEPVVLGIRFEFILFALTLVGIAVFQQKTMHVALAGLVTILAVKFTFLNDFSIVDHLVGTGGKIGEWRILVNLFGLLTGFAILAHLFQESGIPNLLPSILPDDWKGGLLLLFFILVMSAFLDNIAAALIGGTIAMIVFNGRVHIGYLAAIIAAANAGGSGSVLGDTTTTLMWIDGIHPYSVLTAYIAAIPAFLFFGIFASRQQDKFQRIVKDNISGTRVNYVKLILVVMILIGAILTNWLLDFPALGVWMAIFIGTFFQKTPWKEITGSIQGTIFLIALVLCASLMPVEDLPSPTWQSAFLMGFLSAVFDNIPLTKLCLQQGGYDWAMLAYTIGFGGSMIWFGSSAGVALSSMYPQSKSVIRYIKDGWHITIAYVVGFIIMLVIAGWHPENLPVK